MSELNQIVKSKIGVRLIKTDSIWFLMSKEDWFNPYDRMANGNLVTAFLGSYNTKVTISSSPNGYQLNFQVSNTSSWESATRFRIDNDGDGIHDGVFPNTSRTDNSDISIEGNFTQNWYWTEPVN